LLRVLLLLMISFVRDETEEIRKGQPMAARVCGAVFRLNCRWLSVSDRIRAIWPSAKNLSAKQLFLVVDDQNCLL
jgi:hypothetical protein